MQNTTYFSPLSRYFWPLIILFEGFVTVAIEILTIRQMIPFIGNSVIVTSIIIGIFLLFLALGYQRGGRVTENFDRTLKHNFIFTSLWFGVGLSYLFISSYFQMSHFVTDNVVMLLTAYLLLIVAPMIYCLGQTVPLTMNLMTEDKKAGLIGGKVLGLSTVGSFFGATITTLLLMQFLGIAWTIVANVVCLLLLILIISPTLITFTICAGVFTIVYLCNVSIENQLFVRANDYANYQILSDKNTGLRADEKILSINNALSSYTNSQKKGFTYIEKIKQILFEELKLRDANILVLGAGGFSLSAESTYQNQFDYVDIDKDMRAIITPNFTAQLNGRFIADDARHFVHRTSSRYQAIVVDAFNAVRSIPAYLLTREFMQELKMHLTNNGTIIFNIIARPTLIDNYSKRVDNTIRETFKNCIAIPTHYSDEISNILYVCQHTTNESDHTIYSDHLNSATTDSFHWHLPQ